ncbi:MAG: GDP-mannose 4,6-dehydratase [Candidatus Levyibacteriota bacterium]|nr:MAG: GDP-mannose 4,6-dehydratase [Candidatus Levybacteria bacterium]
MTKALITGISGFAGSFLAEYLISLKKYKVSGTYLVSGSLKNLSSVKDNLELTQVDLINQEGIEQLIERERPDVIFHLAALPGVGSSFDKPAETIINNVAAQVHLLEAIRKAELFDCRILVVSSADVYGKIAKEDLPIDEETKFYPSSSYAVSKITQDFLGLQYFLSYNMKIIRARPFNHVGPRQSSGFVIADFAQKIAKIEKGLQEPILNVGNLEARRDFTDVRDMVRAYELLISLGKTGDVYNIGYGKSYKISKILQMFLSITRVKITIRKDQSLLRPQDLLERVCDNSKFVKLTGWKPEITLEQTLKDTLDYWRDIV